jgi:Tol biopolymer transport system component
MPISVGTRFGAYEVAALIGVGGMGEVYRATDPVLKRSVALKVLSESFVGDADRVARLQREAEMLAALNHGNVAHIYGLERSEGTTALVMELVEGQTLAERIAEGRIPVEEALRIAMQIADALEAAHERGVIHRDLKPANIKLRPDGGVKVLDFGIAKALDTATTAGGVAGITTPARTGGVVLGTAAYMSPEQARGKPTDERTDIWSFGCVLYEMLTGQPAFLGEDITSTLARVLERDPDLRLLPSSVPHAVRRTLELCLEKDVRKRVRHIADVRLALTGRFVTDAPRQPRWRRAAAAALLVAGGLLLGVYLESLRGNSDGLAAAGAPAPITRFLITPPAGASIASQNGVDLAISRDGARIAFWTQRVGANNIELYVRDLEALGVRPVPGTALGYAAVGNSFFSPDGAAIAHYRGDGRLYIAAIDGGPPTSLEERMSGFGGGWWAADDTVIRGSGGNLMRQSVADGTSAPLMPPRDVIVDAPVLLPDGHAVLFHAFEAGLDRVEAFDLETRQVTTVVQAASNPAYVDTGHLVFARGDTLMAAPFDASALEVTGEAVALVQGIRRSAGGAADFVISVNGTLAYVPGSVVGSSAAVVWVDRGGNAVGRAVPELVPKPRDPRLSPDGNRLLLVIGDNEGDLWSYDLRGRPPIPLALQNDNRLPVWSPDGQQVAFVVGLEAGGGRMVTLRADGSEATPRPLRTPELTGVPSWWAADELMLIRFTGGQNSQPDILGMPAAPNSEIRSVVATDAFEWDPSLSPDGRWLAYTSTRTGRAEVWVQGYPEGVPIPVSSNGGYEPLWSADGRELFFLQGSELMSTAVETGTEFSFAPPKALFSGPYAWFPTGAAVSYDVARDGRFVMILPEEQTREAASAGIVVVLNFDEELKQRVRPTRR